MNSLRELAPWLQPYAVALIGYAAPYGAVVTSTYRTPGEQSQLYEQRTACRCGYPVARPGHSMHQFRRAFDVAAPAWLLEWMGGVWERWGGRWGGVTDPVHFEA